MGFLKSLGSFAGELVGGVIGGAVELVGDTIGSDFVKDIGRGACAVTANTGKTLGSFAEGAVNCAVGILENDMEKANSGFKEAADTTVNYVASVGKGLCQTVGRGIDTVDAVCEGDYDRAVENGKTFVKVAAIGALSFSVLDALDGSLDGSLDILDKNGNGIPDFLEGGAEHGSLDFVYDNPPVYWVNAPHTAGGGYYRTMPDGSVLNNLSSK